VRNGNVLHIVVHQNVCQVSLSLMSWTQNTCQLSFKYRTILQLRIFQDCVENFQRVVAVSKRPSELIELESKLIQGRSR
jgi:hypothetical protein